MLVPIEAGVEVAAATADLPPALLAHAASRLVAREDWIGRIEGREPGALLHHNGAPPADCALAAWRDVGGRDWDAEDRAVLRMMAPLLGGVLGVGRLQREMERQARTDPLTGLANRHAFLAMLDARLEGAPGALAETKALLSALGPVATAEYAAAGAESFARRAASEEVTTGPHPPPPVESTKPPTSPRGTNHLLRP
jgi:hypothetical protein